MGSSESCSDEKSKETKEQWNCKLCSTMNSKYLSYCEQCLVSKLAQENPQVFRKLTNKLSNECEAHIKADDIKQMANELYEDLNRLNRINKDKKIAQEIQQEINELFAKNNIKCNPNIVQNFINIYHIDDKHRNFKEQRKKNAKCHPICKCGTEMIEMKADKCYDSSLYSCVICDICDKVIKVNHIVFHCPKQKIENVHSDGFDICLPCRKKYIHRLRKFVALIICPKKTDGNINDKDPLILKKMFQKLGFRDDDIVCLYGDKVDIKSVKEALQRISSQNKKSNVNQLTVICYSGHGKCITQKKCLGLRSSYQYYFDLNGEYLSSSELMQYQCAALKVKSAMKDGIKLFWNEKKHNVLYRHNTLLLINSCYSGGANQEVVSQELADQLSKAKMLALLLSILGIELAMVSTALRIVGCVLEESKLNVLNGCLNGCYSLPCIAGCLGITVSQLIAIGIAAGVTLGAVIVIVVTLWMANDKSAYCESVHCIASCTKDEESNAFSISPFIQYCDDFFTQFLNGQAVNRRNIRDSPTELLRYLKACYKQERKDLGGMSLSDLGQNVYGSKRGFKEFALCPILRN